MAVADLALSRPVKLIVTHRGLLLPIAAMMLLLVLLVPLPTYLMDILLATNITASAVILLTVMYVTSPLDFSVFPSLLLAMTLFRLVLNTATTRLILTNAVHGEEAAGKVIATFGQFVASGSLAVGVIIFAIIVIIQFIVITKGATRIAEVAARFTLDGMPGKQMAIDADLNAGLIQESEARRRRDLITREADFFGAMDGASKFVRGDAIAGIVITLINILGGIYVGMVELDMPIRQTLTTFTQLTIGDGLASQIPAFIVSVAAGMLVTRSTAKTNLGEELLGQMVSRPVALGLAASFLGVLTLTPLPKLPLLVLGGGLAGLATILSRTRKVQRTEAEARERVAARPQEKPESFLAIDPMELEVGYGLIKLVDKKQGGDLLDRITNIRRQIAQELGIVVPAIRIRDNIRLEPNQYAVKIRGMEVARGESLVGHLLAIDSGTVTEKIGGTETKDPAFGLPALWIDPDQKHVAEHRNYTVVTASGVVATHLTELIKQHAHELLTRTEVNRLLDNLRDRAGKLVEEVIGELLKPGDLQRVLQNLLRERVSIRDLETILETLGDWAPRTKDTDVLTEYVRNSLARSICLQYCTPDKRIVCITLDPKVEDVINGNLERSDRGTYLAMPPTLQNRIVTAVQTTVREALNSAGGATLVALASPQVRAWVRRLIEAPMPQLPVLSYNEIVRGVEVESKGMVTLGDESEDVSS